MLHYDYVADGAIGQRRRMSGSVIIPGDINRMQWLFLKL